jgi:hypothetical protein
MPLLYPLIRGHRFDFSSAEINVDGQLVHGIKALNYSHALEPGELRGNRSPLIGRTRGEYSAEGSIEMYLAEFQVLITLLSAGGRGYMETSFNIVAAYNELGGDLITDELIGCRLTNADKSYSEGNDGLSVSCDLHIMEIRENGLSAVDPRQWQFTRR